MTYLLGLTGCIGMGKSTTAQMFVEEGCALWDADAAVHGLYAEGGAAVCPIGSEFPEAIVDGAVSRAVLRALIARDEAVLKRLEEIVHPLVTAQQLEFIDTTPADIVVLDIPLLFETGKDREVDAVVVATVDRPEQQRRLAARGTMTPEQIDTIRQQQAPDAEKRRRADHIVITDTIEHARAQVHGIVAKIREEMAHA